MHSHKEMGNKLNYGGLRDDEEEDEDYKMEDEDGK